MVEESDREGKPVMFIGPGPLPPEWKEVINSNPSGLVEVQLGDTRLPEAGSAPLRINVKQAAAFMDKWHKMAEELMPVPKSRESVQVDLSGIVDRMPGGKVAAPVTASSFGDPAWGGFYSVSGTADLRFDFSIQGALAAFYCIDHLEGVGTWWHGLADRRDRQFVLDLKVPAWLLWDKEQLLPTDDKAARCLSKAPGPIVSRPADDIVLEWLCYSGRPERSLSLRGISLSSNGIATALEPQTLIKPSWFVYSVGAPPELMFRHIDKN